MTFITSNVHFIDLDRETTTEKKNSTMKSATSSHFITLILTFFLLVVIHIVPTKSYGYHCQLGETYMNFNR